MRAIGQILFRPGVILAGQIKIIVYAFFVNRKKQFSEGEAYAFS